MSQIDRLMRPFEDLVRFRRANIAQIDSVAKDKLLCIPAGFRNNLFWQAGHLVTTQVSLLYRRTGQPLPIPEPYFAYFGKSTSPADFDHATPAFEEVRVLLVDIMETTKRDLPVLTGLSYPQPITVTSGKIIATFDDALEFTPLHEAYHMGIITAMIKFL